VIYDDPSALESLVNLHRSYEYDVRGYFSAEQFLQASQPEKNSCIISDVHMRRMSGLELLQHLKSSGCDTPIILITGNFEGLSESFYLKHGAIGLLRKPVDTDALVELIRSVLPEPENARSP
jgi:FixJ family two-component response regulator